MYSQTRRGGVAREPGDARRTVRAVHGLAVEGRVMVIDMRAARRAVRDVGVLKSRATFFQGRRTGGGVSDQSME